MAMIFYLAFLLLVAFGKGNEINMLREENLDNDDKAEKEDAVAFESFGSPVYGAGNVISPAAVPLNGKSAYSYPVPPVSPLQALPASYLAYLTALGVGNPYTYGPYNRYNFLPYTASSLYGYGSPLLGNLGSTFLPGPGYTGYGSPYFGRSTYPGAYPGYPGYLSGLGYRYGALAYPAAGSIKAGSAALARAQASAVGLPVPVSRVSAVAAGLPAPVSGVPGPLAGVPAPVAGIPAPVTGVPTPVAPYPASVPGIPFSLNGITPYRPVIRSIQAKDGTLRYTATDI